MQFFKNIKSGEKSQKSSLFGGMKVKGSKQSKDQKNKSQVYAQSETSLTISKKASEEIKPESPVSDDSKIKRQEKVISEIQDQSHQFNVKKKHNQTIETSIKQNQTEVPQNVKEIKTIQKIPSKKSENDVKIQAEQDHKKEQNLKKQKVEDKKIENPRKASSTIRKNENEQPTGKKNVGGEVVEKKKALQKSLQKAKKSDREQLIQDINESQLKIINLIITLKETKQQILHDQREITEMKEKLTISISNQSHFAEIEEYDEADKLQSLIETLQKNIEEKELQLNFMSEQFNKIEYEKLNILQGQFENQKRIIRKLKLVELQLQDDASNIKREESQKIEIERLKYESEKKKIVRMENDIKQKTDQITGYQKTYIEDLNSKREPLLQEKKILDKLKIDVERDIQDLERKLREKKGELVDTNHKIKVNAAQISNVNQTFKEEGVKIKERKNKLELLENQKDDMVLTLNNLENDIKEENQKIELKINQKMKEAEELTLLGKEIQQKQTNFEENMELKKVILDNFIHNAKMLKDFEEKHKDTKQHIHELELKKLSGSTEASKLQDKRKSLKTKIPILESEQKVLANAKNYKAAGLKKNEIKEINDEIELITKKIEISFNEEFKSNAELEQLLTNQQEYIDEENELKQILAISQYKFSASKAEEISEYLLFLNHNKIQNKNKLMLSLEEELEVLKSEMLYLAEEYHINSKKSIEKVEDENQDELEDENQDELEDEQDEISEEAEIQEVRHNVEEESGVEEIKLQQTYPNQVNKLIQQPAEHQYEPPFLQEHEDQEIIEEEEGYVPLQLD